MSNLPPGIDNGIEIWAEPNWDVFIMQNGKKVPFEHIDKLTYAACWTDMCKHPHASAILDLMGIYDDKSQVKKYLACRYGNFDHIPDFGIDGKSNPDYFDCGNRGSCKFEGKLCDRLRVKNGYLTHQEIHVIKLISEDLADKEIANILDISTNTVSTHVANILDKLGVNSRVGICRFCIEHNI